MGNPARHLRAPRRSRHVCGGGGSTNELLTESRIVSGGTVIVSPK
jgi:hypothetical protein